MRLPKWTASLLASKSNPLYFVVIFNGSATTVLKLGKAEESFGMVDTGFSSFQVEAAGQGLAETILVAPGFYTGAVAGGGIGGIVDGSVEVGCNKVLKHIRVLTHFRSILFILDSNTVTLAESLARDSCILLRTLRIKSTCGEVISISDISIEDVEDVGEAVPAGSIGAIGARSG